MNSLVVLGSSAACAYSVVATFAPALLRYGTANVYFETSAVIVTLILLDRFRDAKAKGRTSEAISRLMGLQAKTACVLRGRNFVDVVLDEVQAGDVLQVRPGDRVPVDGTMLTGSSFVDEAMISGEPVPVMQTEGASVIGGTINKTGSFTYRVYLPGREGRRGHDAVADHPHGRKRRRGADGRRPRGACRRPSACRARRCATFGKTCSGPLPATPR
jgi:P-type Cu+ transporter